MKALKVICKLFIIKQEVPTNILIYCETLEYSRSEDSPDPWPCCQSRPRCQSRRCPNSQAVFLRTSLQVSHSQLLYSAALRRKKHTSTGVNYHPFQHLTHCQNLTCCPSCICCGSLCAKSQLFCRQKRTEHHKTLILHPLVTSGVSQSASNTPNSVAKQRESVLLR